MAVTTDAPRAADPPLLPARELDLSRAPKVGAVIGIAVAFIAASGMAQAFNERILIGPWLSLTEVAFLTLAVAAGAIAGRPPAQIEGFAAPKLGPPNILAGAIAGALAAVVLDLFILILTSFEIRDIFVQFSPELKELLLLDQGRGVAMLLWLAWGVGLGVAGGAISIAPPQVRRAIGTAALWVFSAGLLQIIFNQILSSLGLSFFADELYRGTSGGMEPIAAAVLAVVVFGASLLLRGRTRVVRQRVDALQGRQRKVVVIATLAVVALILGALPQILGSFLSATLGTAGSFLLMALGLNIVIGFAGLLDLGYVAFFAVGAYTTAVLTSPTAPGFSPELTFWVAIPFVVLAAALAGLVVGTPVLRMRGDYLAIVTLGFGEIARLIVQSDWQRGTLGGAQGIRRIPPISLGGLDFVSPESFFYLILIVAALFTYITYALQRSRLGRAWNAMREDEPVAEAMGVNVVTAKLWAFVLGAIMASLGGAMFATKLTAVFPAGFSIIVSITVVVIVIVGGMGSVAGVVVGSLVLVGLPEILREFGEFKFLLYGILLIFMMLKRPEGFIPSRRRQRELAEEERMQDAWFTTGGATGTPPPEAEEDEA